MPTSSTKRITINEAKFAAETRVDEITCEALDLFLGSSHQLLSNLEILDQDLKLLRDGKQIAYALDFSEVFTYLFPEKSTSQNRQTSRLLLDSNFLKFTLLPGTIVELVRTLTRLLTKHRSIQRRLLEENIKNPFVDAFFTYLSKNTSIKPGISLTHLETKIEERYEDIRDLELLVSRLSKFKSARNLLSFDEIWENKVPIHPNDEVFRKVESSLNLYRPGWTDINNFVDAHNYSLVWSLTEKLTRSKDSVVMAVTSSPFPFKVFRGIKFPLRNAVNMPSLPAETSLVRHPLQVLSLSQVLERNPTDGHEKIQEFISKTKYVIEELAKNEKYLLFRRGKVPAQTVISLSRKKVFLEKFLQVREEYSRLFSDVRSAVESDLIAEENYRWQKGVTPWAIDARVSTANEKLTQSVSPRVLYKVYDHLTNVTLEVIQKNRRILEAIPENLIRDVDIEGFVLKRPRLKSNVRENHLFECRELSLLSDKSLFLAGDIYKDFFSLWWPSGVAFTEFIDAARTFITNQSKNSRRQKRKLFNGIYIYFVDGASPPIEIPLDDDPELRLESIHGMVGEKRLQMIRIAHAIGDICYDFEPYKNIPQRIGFVSHELNIPHLSWLIYRTNLNKTAIMEWRNALGKVLKAFKGTRK